MPDSLVNLGTLGLESERRCLWLAVLTHLGNHLWDPITMEREFNHPLVWRAGKRWLPPTMVPALLRLMPLLACCLLAPAAVSLPSNPPPHLAQAQESRAAQAAGLLEAGIRLYQRGDFQAAKANWEQALAIYRQLGDRLNEASALNNLGIVYGSLGQGKDGIAAHQAAMAIGQQLQDLDTQARATSGLAVIYTTLGDYRQAIALYQKLIPLWQQLDDRLGEMNALNNLGSAYSNVGQTRPALQAYQTSLALARRLGNRLGESNALSNLGITATQMGRYAEAIDHFQQALALYRRLENRKGEASTLNKLGTIHDILGETNVSIQFHRQALEIQRQIKDVVGITFSYSNLGGIAQGQQRYEEALIYYRSALEQVRQMGRRQDEANILNDLGAVFRRLGDRAQAKQFFQQALQLSRELGDRSGEASGLENLGVLDHDQQRYGQAISWMQQALKIQQQIGDRPSEARLLSSLGETYLDTDRLPEAETSLFQAVTILESLRLGLSDAQKVSLFETQRRTYNILQIVLLRRRQVNRALEIAERGRARAFVELISSRLADSPAAAAAASLKPPDIIEMQRVARSKQATLVQYSLVSDRKLLLVWVILPDGKVQARAVPLKRQPTGFQSATDSRSSELSFQADPNPVRMKRQLQQLHQDLIEPIADLLPSDPNALVVFIPQGPLFLVPFAALQDRKGQYLIQQHTIATAPSIQALHLTEQLRQSQRQRPASRKVLVVGNPVPMPSNLSALPGTEVEAMAIAQLLKSQALVGKQATRAAVLAQLPHAHLIHLATHGLFDEVQGLQSSIVLAASSDQDKGLLTAEALLDMHLQAEMVVLSACNTGRGRVTGDGVIGLSRSLIAAGVPSVVVSLWSVPDSPTAALMIDFYRNLQRQPNKASSLRQTMLQTMKKYPNPINWAAFTLIGAID